MNRLGLRPDLAFYSNLVTQAINANSLKAAPTSVGNLKFCAIVNAIQSKSQIKRENQGDAVTDYEEQIHLVMAHCSTDERNNSLTNSSGSTACTPKHQGRSQMRGQGVCCETVPQTRHGRCTHEPQQYSFLNKTSIMAAADTPTWLRKIPHSPPPPRRSTGDQWVLREEGGIFLFQVVSPKHMAI